MIRQWLTCVILLMAVLGKGQTNTFSIQFADLQLEEVLELVTASTGYFFSYNSAIVPSGSKFTMNASDVTIDGFLNKLLIGTGLQHQVFEDQIILTFQVHEFTNSQTIKSFTISGRVLDVADDLPIQGANIFLSGTNLGGVSDLDGYYAIEDVPFGAYEVIFSHLSYFMNSSNTELFSGGVITMNSALGIRTQILDTIEVTSRRLIGEAERGRYLKIFDNEFLGRSKSSRECEILNPDVLDFIYDPKDDKLEVFSLEPLEVVNQYLGYKILYYFDRFQKFGDNTNFYGKARFRNIKPESSSQKKKWIRNRRKIYRGSFLHFRRALVNDELRKQQFRIAIVPTNDLAEVGTIRAKKLERDDVIKQISELDYQLNFDGFLMITFLKKPDEAYAEQFFDRGSARLQQRSLLLLAEGEVILKKNGRMELPGVSTFGYWYWERIGNLLPENYDQEIKEL